MNNDTQIILDILFGLILFLVCLEVIYLRATVKILEKWVVDLAAGDNAKVVPGDMKKAKIAHMFKAKPKGFVIMPTEDADEIREAIIKKNQSEGRDTKLSDIQ